MATTTPLTSTALEPASSRPITTKTFATNGLVYWHLLSLDAPAVAMMWTWFIARAYSIHLPGSAILAMGIAVWLLYAADRLLDSRSLNVRSSGKSWHADSRSVGSSGLELRHIFHRRHSIFFRYGILAAALALVVLIPKLPASSVRLYAVLGTLLTLYFALIHLRRIATLRLPKEIAVGIFFSAATFIPTVSRDPSLRATLLPEAIVFGLACSLNCLFIYAWEHAAPFTEAHLATRVALRLLIPLALCAMVGSLCLSVRTARWQVPCAVAVAVSLLLLLHGNRRHLGSTTLRAAADLCLLTPVLFVLSLPS